nr:hypothetical protein [Tanacetum cinerariifolium]
MFKVFKNAVENQLRKTINAFRLDRGGEYISQEFKDYLKVCGIVQQLTPPYTPQHNGMFERRNHTLLDMDTPDKLQQRSIKCIFIGYPKEIISYYFYFPPKNKIVVARYVEFFKKKLITQEVSGRAVDLEEIQDEDTSPSEITSEIPMHVKGFEPPQEEVILIQAEYIAASEAAMKAVWIRKFISGLDDESFDQYVSYLSDKMIRKSFPHRLKRATDLLGIIHTDVCGALRHVSTQVENQLRKTINAFRLDRGGEYISQEFKDYFKVCGIVQQLTPPYTPQHNGMFKRRNRTLLDMVQSMMNLRTLPLSFWDYALESVTRILNMVPTKKALVKWDTPNKLQQRSVKCIFIGYPKEIMSYYFYSPPKNKIVVARYVEFFKKKLITQEVSGRAVDLKEVQDEDTSPSEITSEIPMHVKGFEPPQEEVILILRSERIHRAPNRLCLNVEVDEHSLGDLNEPASYKAAMLDSESNKWIDAMNAKIQSMIDNVVWVFVDLPPNCKTEGSKWVFKKNTDMDGIVDTYKARLVAKGYTQLYRVDYEETFSPAAEIRAIRILISIAAFYDYEI